MLRQVIRLAPCALALLVTPLAVRAAEPVLVVRAESVWMGDVIALDDGVDARALVAAGDALAAALAAGGVDVRRGEEALLLAIASAEQPSTRLERARGLLSSGEERYMAFEYGPAAAALAEASGLFTVALAELPPDDLERLYRARLIEGLAWLEAGQDAAAREAFKKLATIRPDFEPDPALMPPHARIIYQQAVGEVMARGTAVIEVSSAPPGANVFIDGIARGKTPVSVTGLPVGAHGLKVEKLGYGLVREEVLVDAGATTARAHDLTPIPARLSLDRLRTGARRGDPPGALGEDLALLARAAGAGGVVLVGVASRGDAPPLVSALLWTPGGSSAAVAKASDSVDAAARRLAAPLLSSSWPAAQAHADGVDVDVDFGRALLGVGPNFGRADVPRDEGMAALWLWGGAGAAFALVVGAAGAGVAAVLLSSSSSEPPPPDRVHVDLVF